MTSLALGIVIGAPLGAGIALFVAAWCMAAGDADEEDDRRTEPTRARLRVVRRAAGPQWQDWRNQ